MIGVNPLSACVLLGIGRRRLRQLVREGHLVLIGQGHKKQVSVESLSLEIARRKAAMEAAAAELRKRISAFDAPSIELERELVQRGK